MEETIDTTAPPGRGRIADQASAPGWICFSGQDWWYHNRAHCNFQLLRRVAKQRPVLFVNSIGMRMPAPGRSTQFARRILRKAKSVARFLKQHFGRHPELPRSHAGDRAVEDPWQL